MMVFTQVARRRIRNAFCIVYSYNACPAIVQNTDVPANCIVNVSCTTFRNISTDMSAQMQNKN